jgi:hypothetical protein
MELVEKAMKWTGCKDKELMQIFLDFAQDTILSETRRTTMINALVPAQLDLAICLYNRSGSEGESSRSEGGISITYSEMPSAVQKTISQYRLARCGGRAFEKTETTESEEISED